MTSNLAFREKSAWTGLLTTVAIYCPYFTYVFIQVRHGTLSAVVLAGAFFMAVVLQMLLMAGAHIVFALHGKPENKDERDLVIEARSFRYAYIVITACTWTAIGGVLSRAGIKSAEPGNHQTMLWLMQALLLAFVLAEGTKFLAQVISYRRGY